MLLLPHFIDRTVKGWKTQSSNMDGNEVIDESKQPIFENIEGLGRAVK